MYLLKKNVDGVLLDVGVVEGDYDKAIATLKSENPSLQFLASHTVVIVEEMYELVEIPVLSTADDFQSALAFHSPVSV
jgi:hypothetical protein